MGAFLKDLRFGARALIKKPGSAIVSVVVLSLDIGLSAFMFSLVYGVFYRGMDVPQEDRVAAVWFQDLSLNPLGGQQRSIASQDFLEIRERLRSFGELSAYYGSTVNLSGVDGPDNRAVGPRRSTSCLARVRVSFTLGFLHRSREGFL